MRINPRKGKRHRTVHTQVSPTINSKIIRYVGESTKRDQSKHVASKVPKLLMGKGR